MGNFFNTKEIWHCNWTIVSLYNCYRSVHYEEIPWQLRRWWCNHQRWCVSGSVLAWLRDQHYFQEHDKVSDPWYCQCGESPHKNLVFLQSFLGVSMYLWRLLLEDVQISRICKLMDTDARVALCEVLCGLRYWRWWDADHTFISALHYVELGIYWYNKWRTIRISSLNLYRVSPSVRFRKRVRSLIVSWYLWIPFAIR